MNYKERAELEQIANMSPTRLERRLAKKQLQMSDAMDASARLGLGPIGTFLTGALGIIGVIFAIIPTLIYFAIIMVPLLMMYTCVSHF